MEFLDDAMQTDLIELWKIQESLRVTGAAMGMEPVEERLRELLGRAKAFIAKYGPDSYTVSVGFPLSANMSFTWESKKRPGPRFLKA